VWWCQYLSSGGGRRFNLRVQAVRPEERKQNKCVPAVLTPLDCRQPPVVGFRHGAANRSHGAWCVCVGAWLRRWCVQTPPVVTVRPTRSRKNWWVGVGSGSACACSTVQRLWYPNGGGQRAKSARKSSVRRHGGVACVQAAGAFTQTAGSAGGVQRVPSWNYHM